MSRKRKYNIYKIKKENEVSLIKELTEKKLEIIGETEIDGHKLELYFLQKDNEGSIWWVEQYKSIFKELDSADYSRSNLYGVIIIKNDNYIYAVSYGNSYFYLQKYCDYNFGLDLAERLVDSSGVHSKVSKYFNINKSKEIVVYNNNINLEFDEGEATFYVQAKPIDTDKFGKNVKFGYSASFQIDIEVSELINFIKEIELHLIQPPKFKVPRVKVLSDKIDKDLINVLDEELYNDIKNRDLNVRFEFLGLVGTNLITEDNISYKLYVKNSSKREKVDTLNVDIVKDYIIKNNIDSKKFNDIRISFESETNNIYSRNLKEVIDYTIEKNGKYYCIVNGKWSEFNESYIEYLEENLNRISSEIESNSEYNFKVEKIEELKRICKEKTDYNEFVYNKYYMCGYGFECYDRNFIKYGNVDVELGDLYKDNTLYHVKIGENGKLIYAIDQSTLSVKVLKDPNKREEVNGKLFNREIKSIGLLFIFDSKTIIKNNSINLNSIKSIIFKMKIMEWYHCVKENNFTPKLLINFKE